VENCYFWPEFSTMKQLIRQQFSSTRLFLFFLTFVFVSGLHAQDEAIAAADLPDEQAWVDSVYNSLNAEQRIAQLFVVRANQPGRAYDSRIEGWIKLYNIGGVTFFKGNPVDQLVQTNRWQQLAKTPLLISIDGEWGLAMRLDNTVSYPMQMTLGAVQNDSLIGDMGFQIAEQCSRMGIQMNFAPVVDVNSNPANPVIGMRSFGERPENVAKKAWMYANSLQKNNIIATAKHFPGHGDTYADSHKTLPVVNATMKRLEEVELVPFRQLIDSGIGGVMVAHLYLPALENKKDLASTLSPKIVGDLLKQKMDFKGLIVTDALDMKGVTAYHPPGKIELMALMAGNDVLLLPENLPIAIQSIAKAASEKADVASRVEESCRKILAYKYRAGLHVYRPSYTENLIQDLNQPQYATLASRLYDEAITLLKNEDGIIPLLKHDSLRIATLSTGYGKATTFQLALENGGLKADHFALPKAPVKAQTEKLYSDLSAYDLVVVSVQNTNILAAKKFGIDPQTIAFINQLIKTKKVLLCVFASPYSLAYFDHQDMLNGLVVAYQDNILAESSAARLILGSVLPQGKLPVSVDKHWQVGAGISAGQSPETVHDSIKTDTSVVVSKAVSIPMLNEKILHKVDSVALDGISKRAFPGCQIVASLNGQIIYNKCFGYHTYENTRVVMPDDLYDLASLTKMLASTMAIMKLTEEGKLMLSDTLGRFFPYLKNTDKARIPLSDIMTHQSGFTDWIPFYLETMTKTGLDTSIYCTAMDVMHPNRVAEGIYARRDYKNVIFGKIAESKMKKKEYRYSDLGFYFMPAIVEMLTNVPFDIYLETAFYQPLKLTHTLFQPLTRFDRDIIVPTELDNDFRKQLIQGDVHDQGAALLGGISGHAGLFSNAAEVATIMQMLINGGNWNGIQLLKPETIQQYTAVQYPGKDNRRGLGFDKPPLKPGEKLRMPSINASQQSYGHSGFTGTFAWADPANKLVVVFLSNRVYPDSKNGMISKLDVRTRIHDLFYEAIKDIKE